ncbi:hypothetical protein [Flavobacterium beibuense]|uniref:hypothetical protein n=1 Tax=Flavobacterium beibuense TaxID=657326 RepID=UPI003A922CA8
MTKNIILSLITLLLIAGCNKNQSSYHTSDFRTELQPYIKRLSKERQIPVRDTIAHNFITTNCTREELLQLINHESPILRVTSYRILVDQNDKDYFTILNNHLNDTTKVEWWYYTDAAKETTVTDLMIRKLYDTSKLTRTQKNTLIDSVLTSHLYLETSMYMMQDIAPQEKYYETIKQMCLNRTDRCGTHLSACYALSKFKKKEDVQFLKNIFINEESCKIWIFRSIENYPDPEYFEILEKYLNNNIRKEKQINSNDLKFYFGAIAAYQNEQSLNILKQLTKKESYQNNSNIDNNIKYALKAIHKHKSPLYNDLYNELKPKVEDYIMKYIDEPYYLERTYW